MISALRKALLDAAANGASGARPPPCIAMSADAQPAASYSALSLFRHLSAFASLCGASAGEVHEHSGATACRELRRVL